MKLTNPTDDELNRAFAEYVAGWVRVPQESTEGCIAWTNPNNPYAQNRVWFDGRQYSCHGAHDGWPSFCTSADAVLPWLEKEGCALNVYSHPGKGYYTIVLCAPTGDIKSSGKTFARSAVIALLRAHGVEVEA